MKKYLFSIIAVGAYLTTSAQTTLDVTSDNVTYHFTAEQTGIMPFAGGQTLTIQGKTFELSGTCSMTVNNTSWTDNTVTVTYEGASVKVDVAGNVAQYLEISAADAEVTITQSDEVGDLTCGEITYILIGESNSGSFTLNGNYKASIELHGVTLTSQTGAAINIQNGKRTAIRVAEGTFNSLCDAATGSQKAALYCSGHLEFKQKGTLTVSGKKAHAISAKEYIEVKNTNINILEAAKDGINCNQYMLVESGTINISGTADDGIQVAFKDATDRDAEDTGTMTVKGGSLTIDVTATAAKAIKTEGDFVMSGGEITATVSGGGLWDSAKLKTKAAACIGVDGNVNITDGTFNLNATNGGGKGISADGSLNISGGTFNIFTTGGMLAYVNGSINNNYTGNADNLNSNYKSSPKGIKVDGTVVIDGGTFLIETKGQGGEGIESKQTLTINGGDIKIHAYDDGTNSTSHTYINGGNIEITTGKGDAIDSNGAIYVTGGYLTIIGAGGSEQGFDAGDNYTIYITGGTMLAAGGGNSAPTNSQSTQAYVTLSQAVTAGTTVSISLGATELASFVIPAKYGTTTSSASAPQFGPGGWGWGWEGSSGNALLISTPEMVSGTTYTIKAGSTTVTATAKLTGGSTGPGQH